MKTNLSQLASQTSVVTSRASELRKVEDSLEQKTGELGEIKQKIDVSSKLLK